MAREAGIPLLEGSSMKAALDVDWTDLNASHGALQRLLGEVGSLSSFIATHLAEERDRPALEQQLATLQQMTTQDLEPDPSGKGTRIKRGVARERRISITDPGHNPGHEGRKPQGRKGRKGRGRNGSTGEEPGRSNAFRSALATLAPLRFRDPRDARPGSVGGGATRGVPGVWAFARTPV